MASKPPVPTGKMKKPAAPYVQTSVNSVKPTQPSSSSPSSATKRLPGQTPTPANALNGTVNVNGGTRPSRRPQRLTTRANATENTNMERRAARKYPEPYVSSESHMLKKFKGRSPSLIVHLHPTHFRFDQQDGSFSYQSEMRIFIEHLKKKTIPHDMLEEFRKSDVQFYDGWLIVRVYDHKSAAKAAASSNAASEDEQVNSIHKWTIGVTPSPYAPYPRKEQASLTKSPPMKQEPGVPGPSRAAEGSSASMPNVDTIEVAPRAAKPQPRIFTVALRPTNLSRHIDLVLDAMMPDPKALNRRQSQIFVNGRTPASSSMAAPPTPLSTIPPTPSAEKGPPFKKQKLKIEPKDLLEYEARVVNATAPPLYLDAVDTFEEVQTLLAMLADPLCDCEPPSPKSRKRTVAELAADDAHAKGQERFMQIMDERFSATVNGGNGGVDGQAGNGLFQPRFEKFIALEKIKTDLSEKKKAEEARKLHEDENRQRVREDEQRRAEELQRQRAQQENEIRRRQQIQAEVNRRAQATELAKQQQIAQHQLQRQAQQQQAQQQQNHPGVPNGVPPNMRAGQPMAQQSSPLIRQGSPLAKSSPMVGNAAQMAQSIAMSATGSNPGAAGSPPRPGSALQHGHPGVPMARGPSNQGPSRNGTPQMPSSTPGLRHATPIMRQGTPNPRMTQASPHANMMAHTPQMGQAGMAIPGQMPNGMTQLTPQQIAAMNQRNAMMQQQAAVMAQQGIPNGNPLSSGAAQMAHLQAQRQAQLENQQALMHQQQQRQMQQMAGTPQQQPAQSPAMQNPATHQQQAYQRELAKRMQSQMQNQMQHGQAQNHGSPVPSQQPTPQQQHAAQIQAQQQHQQQLAMQAAAQAQQQGGQMPNGVPHPQQQAQSQLRRQNPLTTLTLNYYKKYMNDIAHQKYGGNTAMLTREEQAQLQNQAQVAARQHYQRSQQQHMQNQQMRQMAQQQGQGGQNMQAMMAQQQQQMQGGGQRNPSMEMAMMQAQAMHQMQQTQMNQQQAHGGADQHAQQARAQADALASKAAYQAQLQNMLQQNQAQGGGGPGVR